MKIIINNTIYDISTFISEHPGGAEVFNREPTVKGSNNNDEIIDYTEKFNEVGHSEYAINLLENYKVKELSEDDPRFNREHKLEYNKNKISKLITHEDKFHIHKIMGGLSLLNYIYLLGDCFYSGWQADLSLRQIDGNFIGMTWIHSILSLSALQFLIPRTRTGILPMIWQEFRAHSIVFAVRSFLLINVLYLAAKIFNVDVNNITSSDNNDFNITSHVLRIGAVLLAMKMADLSTEYLRENKKETTTATMPYWSDCPAGLQSAIKYFYTHSQFMATFVCLYGKLPYILAVAFPIQFASFMMTLVRKNIISSFWYHVLYGGSLLLVYLINAADIKMYPVIILGIFLIYLRVHVKLNKYVLWILVSIIGFIVKFVKFDSESWTATNIMQVIISLIIAGIIISKISKSFGLDVDDIEKHIFDKTQVREESNHRVLTNVSLRASDIHGNDIMHRNSLISIKLCESFPKFRPGMYFNLFFDNKKRPYSPIEYMSKPNSNGKSGEAEGEEIVSGDIINFFIKRVDTGEVSPNICDKYLVGNTVFLKGPFGRKYYDSSQNIKSFVCDGNVIKSKHVIMCSCGSGITPFYSMCVAWISDNYMSSDNVDQHQKLHLLSSYTNVNDAILTKKKMIQMGSSKVAMVAIGVGETDNANVAIETKIVEKLFLSSEKNKLTPSIFTDYINELHVENNEIVVFTCGTNGYCKMIKDCCAMTNITCYEW